MKDAEVKYSTVQNWYAGDKNGKGGIYNFVTKRGHCKGINSKIMLKKDFIIRAYKIHGINKYDYSLLPE